MKIKNYYVLFVLFISIISLETHCAAKILDETQEEAISALCVAVEAGDVERIKNLIKEGVDIESQPMALIKACQKDRKIVVELLLDNGADVNCTDELGNTPLIISADKGFEHLVKLLLQRKADVNIRNMSGSTALAAAIDTNRDRSNIVELLLDAHVDYELPDASGKTLQARISQYPDKGIWRKKVLGGRVYRNYILNLLTAEPHRREMIKKWHKKIMNEIPQILPSALINLVGEFFEIPYEYSCHGFAKEICGRRIEINQQLRKCLSSKYYFDSILQMLVLEYLPDEATEYIESLVVQDREKRKEVCLIETEENFNPKRIKLNPR